MAENTEGQNGLGASQANAKGKGISNRGFASMN
jgi:hypothetical protein